MKKIISLLVILFLFVACAPKAYNVPFERRVYNEPEKNQILIKEIGERLVMKAHEDYQKRGLKIVNRPERISINTVTFPYSIGTTLPLSAEIKDYFLYYDKKGVIITEGYAYSKYTGYVRTKRETIVGIAESKKRPERRYPFISTKEGTFGNFYSKTIPDFETEFVEYSDINCEGCFKSELIYNGKSGNQIKLIYREFIENLARPAFYQELQYDLSESNIIGFKGVRIEVLEATNINVKYKIISYFN